jgi:hypothetical protein
MVQHTRGIDMKHTKAIMPLEVSPYMPSQTGGYFRIITFWDICNDCEVITYHYEDMRNAQHWEFLDELDLETATALIEGNFKFKRKASSQGLPIINADSKPLGYKVIENTTAHALAQNRPSMPNMAADEYEFVIDSYSHGSKYTY